MSGSNQPEVVSSTKFNTVVENKVNRKELIDMIMEEQEALLEDELEQKEEEFSEANSNLAATRKQVDETVMKAVNESSKFKKKLQDAKKLFDNKKVELNMGVRIGNELSNAKSYDFLDECDIDAIERHGLFHLYKDEIEKINPKDIKVKLSTTIELHIPNSQHRFCHDSRVILEHLSNTKAQKLKGVKAEVKKHEQAYRDLLTAQIELEQARQNMAKFKKKGKRAKNKFIREMLKSTPDGQALLENLDSIKKSTQKLLE